jgi:hypothetical protein
MKKIIVFSLMCVFTVWLCARYVPYVGDSKRALDEYTSEIFMGGKVCFCGVKFVCFPVCPAAPRQYLLRYCFMGGGVRETKFCAKNFNLKFHFFSL